MTTNLKHIRVIFLGGTGPRSSGEAHLDAVISKGGGTESQVATIRGVKE